MVTPEIDVGGSEVVAALVIAPMVVVIDEGCDLGFEITRQEVVFEQDAVLQRLVPALDLALRCSPLTVTSSISSAIV